MRLTYASLSLVLALTALATTGCATFSAGAFPDASVNPEQATLGSIQGNNFGGHAPLVGAHVYVLQPGTSGYGAQATSLLSATSSANGYPTAQNSGATDPGIPTNWYYETTDSTGAFNLTGDYTCTVGLPVYLYLYGGSPTYPSANNVFSVNQVVVSGESIGLGLLGAANFTLTTTTTENFYVGEQVVGSNFGTGFTNLNTTLTVTATSLSTTTFTVSTNAVLLVSNGTYATTGTITAEPTNNAAVVNLAVLGNCPSGGFTGANAINYVYVNEVATTAAAYAFQPFTLPTNNRAIDVGTTSTNIAGIQNAAVIAKQLYDITGSKVSTTYAGEGHIANTTTVAGNGIVPQANLDTLGNILAQCVDSNDGSTTVGTTGTTNSAGAYTGISAQCNVLFQNATNTGIPTTSTGTGTNAPGTQPFDTAMAAINIARHPAGPPYSYSSTGSSTFITNLYTLPTGNPPFAPNLVSTGAGKPNDFTIAIDYTSANNPYNRGPESLAIDKIGDVWFTSQINGGTTYNFFQMSPTGVVGVVDTNTSYIYGYVTIDSGESAWAGAANSSHPVSYVHATATPTAASGSAPVTYTYASPADSTSTVEYFTYASASDGNGNVYFGTNKTAGTGTDYVQTFSVAATTPTVAATLSAAVPTVNSDVSGFSHAAMDPTGDIYFDYNASGGNSGNPYITRVVPSTGASATANWPISNSNGTSGSGGSGGCSAMTDPESMAVTHSGDVIVSAYDNGNGAVNAASSSAYYITAAGVCTQLSGASLEAGLNSPFGTAIDGNSYVYITNRGGSTISVLNTSGGTAASTVAVSPSTGYEPQYVVSGTLTNMLNQPLNIATGPSGEIWITDFTNGSIVEIIGLAAPTTTPLSVASGNGGLGNKP